MKYKSKLMPLVVMLAFVLAISFTLAPNASAAVASSTFAVTGINIGGIYDENIPATSSATKPTINFPYSNTYKPFYICPPINSSGGKGVLSYVRIKLNANLVGTRFEVYGGHRTSGTDIKASVYQNSFDTDVTVYTDKMTYYNSGTDSQGRKWRDYQITVYHPSFKDLVYLNIKIEIP